MRLSPGPLVLVRPRPFFGAFESRSIRFCQTWTAFEVSKAVTGMGGDDFGGILHRKKPLLPK